MGEEGADGGWHVDPLGMHRWRWHDGDGWTDLIDDRAALPAARPDGPAPAAEAPDFNAARSHGTDPVVEAAGQPPGTPSGTAPTGQFRSRGRLQLAILIASLTAVAVAVLLITNTRSHAIEGEFVLLGSDDDILAAGDTCFGRGGYSDIREGLSVTVRDGRGTIIGTSELGSGSHDDGFLGSFCTFGFTVDGLSLTDFYEIEVGTRGSLSYSYAELDGADWYVGFSLGD